MSDYSLLHELEVVSFFTDTPRSIAEAVNFFRKNGFKIDDDICYLKRKGKIPLWQHSAIVEVKFFRFGEEVYDFKSEWDRIELEYLYASLPKENIPVFLSIVFQFSKFFNLPPYCKGREVSKDDLELMFEEFERDLERELGEVPGSKSLAIHILGTYPR